MGDEDEDKKKDKSSDYLKFSKYTSEKPDPIIPLMYFFVITCIYTIITIVMGGGSTMQKVIMKSCYILAVIVGEYVLNMKLSYYMCRNYQWESILFITIVPWLLIFCVMHLFLSLFPGWLSPFSNTFGYLAVKLMGLPDLMQELKPEKIQDPAAFQVINSLMNDPSLLINQYSPEEVKDIKDPNDPLGIKIIQTRPLFDGVWANLKDSGLIKKFDDIKENDKFRDKLYRFVDMKYTISEFVWNLLAGGLVTSVSYNYIIDIGCVKPAEEIKERQNAYQAAQKKKLEDKTIKQQNDPDYRQSPNG
jgi:hypothetical protein